MHEQLLIDDQRAYEVLCAAVEEVDRLDLFALFDLVAGRPDVAAELRHRWQSEHVTDPTGERLLGTIEGDGDGGFYARRLPARQRMPFRNPLAARAWILAGAA
jgi:hypothetical protein